MSVTRELSTSSHPISEVSEGSQQASAAQESQHKKSTVPSGVPISKIFGMLTTAFPLGVSDSFSHWMDRKDLLGVQQELVDSILRDDEHLPFEIKRFVSKNDANIFKELNELVIPSRTGTKDKHIVFVHGYGAGLGFFIKNLAALAKKHSDWNIHAIDLPGYGCSSRPSFPHKIPTEDNELVERLYTTPLREWFVERQMNENNTIVVAHSMGAYLLAILGVNEVNHKNHLEDLKEKLPQSSFTKLFSRWEKPDVTFENEKITRKFWSTLVMVSPGGVFSERTPSVPKWFVSLWNRNISPFVAVRYSSFLGSKITSGWTNRRFALDLLSPKEQEIMHRYAYGIFSAKGSGEYMLNYLLAPGAFPRHPLYERIEDLSKVTKRTLWLYGDHDWMEPKGGILSAQKLSERGCESDVEIIRNAGHHIYLDNFDGFNAVISREMDRINS